VILETLEPSRTAFETGTGWELKPEGLCKGESCVPFPMSDGDTIDIRAVAEHLHMPLVHDEKHAVWALGPPSGGHALQTAEAPDLVLPTIDGEDFALRSLRGQKVFLLAWASW
jgi:hypothetical protein